MRTSERHHLKENDLAIALGQAGDYVGRNRSTVVAIVGAILVIALGAAGFMAWRSRAAAAGRAELAEAMVIAESRVAPPAPAVEGQPAAAQQPGTYPTERAKLEAALPKFLAVADAYPNSDAGRTARYHAASTLVELGRFPDAIAQYDRVIEGGELLGEMARLGKAEAQIRAAQYDPAIATFKELSERTDSSLPKEALLLELARAYKLAGKTEDARKTLTQIVEQHAESPFAADARQELEKIKG
jgi:tetratricopeptide (TPR) repeat protein